MNPPIRLSLRPVQPIALARVPAAPVRLERLTQEAPQIRLSGVTVIELDYQPSRYEQTFAAAPSWTANHNFGRTPNAVRVLSPGGVEVEAEIVETSINQIVVLFASPQAGRVVII